LASHGQACGKERTSINSKLDQCMNTCSPFDLIIGLDRSDHKADWHLINPGTRQRQSLTLDTAPEALWEWLLQLRQQYPGARVGLCLEQPAGHLLSFLEAYEWITLYPINPITLKKYREAFVTSRAKDDGKDAQYLAELLWHHADQLQAWAPEDSPTRAVRQLVFHRRAVVDERTALSNRLKSLLKQYFPQALSLCGEDLWRPLATAFLLKWPSLHALQKAQTARVKQFYYLHGSRSVKLLEQRLALIENAVPVSDERAYFESFVLRAQLICRQLQLVQKTVAEFDEQIARAFAAHPDREIFKSLPGAGPVLGPRLLASVGSQRERFERPEQLQRYTGIAPVTKQSGG
jgi:transposase